jgi:hypothetical protein
LILANQQNTLTNKTLFLRILIKSYQLILLKEMTFIINYNGFENVKKIDPLLLIKRKIAVFKYIRNNSDIDYELMIASKCDLFSNNCK